MSRLSPATVVVTAGRPEPAVGAPVNVPVTMSSTYIARPGDIRDEDPVYGRFENATWTALEEVLAMMEGGAHGLVYSAGLAAVSAVVDLVPQGGKVVSPVAPFSGTAGMLGQLAERGRLRYAEVPVADTEAVVAALPGADLLFLESPTNPMLEVADIPALAAAAHEQGAILAVDNTFATPLLQNPLALGADIVVHSATKYLSGHSDVLLGATVTDDDELAERLYGYRSSAGAIAGPWETWLVLRGLRTLALRVERAGSNAAELAVRLQAHPGVARVRHPSLPDDPGHVQAVKQMSGFGAVIGLEPVGGVAAAERMVQSVEVWLHATSLGGVESSLERRHRHAVESPVVPESLLRLSVGIEDVEDLWTDLEQALAGAARE